MKKIMPIDWTDKVGMNISGAVNAIIDNFSRIDKEIQKELNECNIDVHKTISSDFNPNKYR